MVASKTPLASSIPTSSWPVRRHQASASRAKPGSVARTLIVAPGSALSASALSRMMGPGHWRPQASTSMVLKERAAMDSGMPEPSA